MINARNENHDGAIGGWFKLITRGGVGGGGGFSTKFYTGRLHPDVQTLTLLYTIIERKDTPFVYLLYKILPLSYTYGASFTKLFI